MSQTGRMPVASRDFDGGRMSKPSGTEAAVCEDIARRQDMGIAKYGTTVADNPLELRAWLQHAYEEALDQAIYLKRAIAEIDGGKRVDLGRGK